MLLARGLRSFLLVKLPRLFEINNPVPRIQYVDGFSYSKYKMEEAFRPGGFLDKPPAKSAAAAAKDPNAPAPKREDVDIIVHEFELSRTQAEKILAANDADLGKALRALVAAP